MRSWLQAASAGSALRRTCLSSIVVGAVLTVVNHGPQLAHGQLDAGLGAQVGLTLLIPFLVSLSSSVAAIRDLEVEARPAGRRH